VSAARASGDAAAEAYDAWYRTPVGALTDALEKAAVFSLLREPPGRAIDLSCGTGTYAFELRRRGWRAVGLDRSLPMLRRAVLKARAAVDPPRFVLGDAACLPIRSASVELVTIILGLEFMAEPARAFEEARRVLAPGGRLVVAVLAPGGAWTLWRRLKRRLGASVWREARFLDEPGLRHRLAECGFLPVSSARAVHFLPIVPWVRLLERWERLARRWAPGLAAFVVLGCELAAGRVRHDASPARLGRGHRPDIPDA
jgi:SAM-dependent methyltransferase